MRGTLWCLCFLALQVPKSGGLRFENLFNFTKENASVVELFIPTLNSENERCREHSRHYFQELKSFRLWAAEMFDATAKFPSGVLHGSIYSLGNFDQCVEVKVPYGANEFAGKYCLAKFAVNPTNYLGVDHNIDYIQDDYEKYFNISAWEKVAVFSRAESKASRNEVYSSFCLPSSCTNEDLERSLENIANSYKSIADIEVTVHVDKRSCQVGEELVFTIGDIAFITTVASFALMVILASIYHLSTRMEDVDHYKTSCKLHKIILCFSFPYNLKKLASKSKNEDGLDCICGLKTLSMFFIIMGHRCMFTFGAPLTNAKFIEEMYTKVEATVFLNGPIIVDTFFVISGFLAAYLTLHFFEKNKFDVNVLMIYLHRIIRLLPSYAIVLAFYCTLFVKIGSGPFWQERVGLEQERCLQSWWANLLHINNYVNVDKLVSTFCKDWNHQKCYEINDSGIFTSNSSGVPVKSKCMFQSWYLTCDMHYFLLTPLLVWLLRKKPTVGLLTVFCLIVLSISAVFVTVYVNNEDGILLLYTKLLKDPILNKTFSNIYIPTHLRASPYFVGIITAFIKYRMKTTGYKMSKHILYAGWIMSVFIVIATVYTAFVFYIPGYPQGTIFSAFYASAHHFTFSLCMSWIIIAVSSRNGAWIEPILSWKPLILLSRITYTAFLCHGAIQIATSAMMRVPRYTSVFNVIYDTFGDITYAYVAGFILSMHFEAPIIGIEKIVFRRDERPSDSKAVVRQKAFEKVVISIPKIKTIT